MFGSRKRAEAKTQATLRQLDLEIDLLDACAAVLQLKSINGSGWADLVTKKGETVLLSLPAALFEPRRTPGRYVGGYSGFSTKVTKGLRFHTGTTRGTYQPGPEVQTVVDQGIWHVTTTRAVFVGSKRTIEWPWSKLVAIDTSLDCAVTLAVSNRQKVHGVGYDQGVDIVVDAAIQGVLAAHAGESVADAVKTVEDLAAGKRAEFSALAGHGQSGGAATHPVARSSIHRCRSGSPAWPSR